MAEKKESPAQRFRRIAKPKINKAVHRIELCEQLANHEFTEAEGEQMVLALRGAVDRFATRIANPEVKSTSAFDFAD